MQHASHTHWKVWLLLGLCLTATGFRPVTEYADNFLQEAEQSNFNLQSHAELYEVFTFKNSGQIIHHRMIIAYRYDEEDIVGIFRLLPDENQPGAIAMLRQVPAQIPDLYLRDPRAGFSGLVPLADRKNIWLGETGWYLEDIYDDDKSVWEHSNEGAAWVDGRRAEVIRSRYADRRMARHSISAYRKIYLDVEERTFLNLEYYNEKDELIRTFTSSAKEVFTINGERQVRTLRLLIQDYQYGLTTVAQRVASNFTTEVPRDFFDIDYVLNEWSEATDERLLAMMTQRRNDFQ